jgi:hypothetical protein
MAGADREPRPVLRLVVHWGPLLVDVHTSNPPVQLRAVGETLAWPVRLIGQAAPGEILVSREIGHLVQGWCELQAREAPLSGEPSRRIRVYAVLGNRPQWSRRDIHRLRPLSRFVGREQELATLNALLLEVERSRGQVVGVIGEPGVGKSRLCYEFIRSSRVHPWSIFETQGTAYSKASPYRALIDLLKGYFRVEDRDDPPTLLEKVTVRLRCLDDTLTPTAPAFLTLFDVPVVDPQWQALDAPQRRQRTLDAVKCLLLCESQVQPLLLVVENLHWIDTETQAILDTVIESLPAARLLLLTTYRPEYRHGWGSKAFYIQLRLHPLPRDRAQALLEALLGDDAALEPLKHLLLERTAGNPFFLEESARAGGDTSPARRARGLPLGANPLEHAGAGDGAGSPRRPHRWAVA